jgi:hypothetical protein
MIIIHHEYFEKGKKHYHICKHVYGLRYVQTTKSSGKAYRIYTADFD